MNSIISDENYVKLLQIINKNIDSDNLTDFDTDDVKKELRKEEYLILNEFINEALENDIITKISHYENNKYKFNNPLYVIYVRLENIFKD